MVTRIFSTMVDFIILIVITTIITRLLEYAFFTFGAFDKVQNLEVHEYVESIKKMEVPSIVPIIISNMFFQLFLIFIYYIVSYIWMNRTFGQVIMNLKVVNSRSFAKLSSCQHFIRVLCFALSPIGIWFIAFTKQKQALHDMIVGSVVIKG